MWKNVRICDLCIMDGNLAIATHEFTVGDGWHDICAKCEEVVVRTTATTMLLEHPGGVGDKLKDAQTEIERLLARTSELAQELAARDPEETRVAFSALGLEDAQMARLLAAVDAMVPRKGQG